MSKSAQRRTILMADDDGEDCTLVGDALRATGRACDLHFVHNGEELFDYLCHRGEFEDGRNAPRPDLILLDLKMPRKDGRETLRELKADPRWRQIPVIALTTSTACSDVAFCYDMGVNAYVAKPATYRKLVDMLDKLTKYWFEMVQLPPKVSHGGRPR
jgi:two-component system, response regulator